MTQMLNVPALKRQWVLDAQWTDCPPEVEKDIQALWRYHELGNDHYMLRLSVKDLQGLEGCEVEEWDNEAVKWKQVPLETNSLQAYILAKGIPEDEDVILHWWW
jgi:hypothetical protein